MTAKQTPGSKAPDGSTYAVITTGSGLLDTGANKQATGTQAPDGSYYFTLTNGNGTLI